MSRAHDMLASSNLTRWHAGFDGTSRCAGSRWFQKVERRPIGPSRHDRPVVCVHQNRSVNVLHREWRNTTRRASQPTDARPASKRREEASLRRCCNRIRRREIRQVDQQLAEDKFEIVPVSLSHKAEAGKRGTACHERQGHTTRGRRPSLQHMQDSSTWA